MVRPQDTPLVMRPSTSTVEDNLAVFNRLDGIKMEVMVFTTCRWIGLRQLDALAFNVVNCADMLVVGADHFHVCLDPGCICH